MGYYESTFPVVEIFGPTIQGEGPIAGKRCLFVRFGGCDRLPAPDGKGRQACRWCDSMHAVDKQFAPTWSRMTAHEISDRLWTLGLASHTRTVILSGGNPCLYDLEPLMFALDGRYDVWVETQGTVYRPWLNEASVVVSPKPPSAGRCDEAQLARFIDARFAYDYWGEFRTAMKIPVDPGFENGADLEFARRLFKEYSSEEMSLHLSTVTYPQDTRDDVIERWRAIVEWVKDVDMADVHVLPQLHVLLWAHERGV